MLRKVQILIFLLIETSCGINDIDKNTSTSSQYSFSTDIAPILNTSCGGESSCHTNGESGKNYVGDQTLFSNTALTIYDRLNRDSTDSLVMPPESFSHQLSALQKQIILDYLSQYFKN